MRKKVYLAVTNYFSEWAEVITVRDFVPRAVYEFIRIHIIYGFGVLETITGDTINLSKV